MYIMSSKKAKKVNSAVNSLKQIQLNWLINAKQTIEKKIKPLKSTRASDFLKAAKFKRETDDDLCCC